MATPIPKNEVPFSLSEALAATGGAPSGNADATLSIRGVSTDTRTVEPGQLFVALAGDRFDGHEHLAAAAERGAVMALVEREVSDAPLPLLRVPSTLEGLGQLAATHLQRWRKGADGRVAALTGSAGKTTTKTVLGALVGIVAPDEVLVTPGNLNNRIGVPLTVLSLTSQHRFAVLELGTNEPGEIAALSRIAQADVGVITLISAAHTEGLGDVEAVAVEKGALFASLPKDGVAVGNADDSRVATLLEAAVVAERLSYGHAEGAAYRVRERALVSPVRQRVTIDTPRGALSFVCPILGAPGALACAGALAACDALTGEALEADQIDGALASASEALGDRMAPRELPSGTWIIDDSYNANPASCRASIATAKELADHLGRRLVLVLGEMRELGDVSVAEHRALGAAAAAAAELVICVGGDAEHTCREAARSIDAVFADESSEAALLATSKVRARDVVLVKGSRGVRTERVVQALIGGAA